MAKTHSIKLGFGYGGNIQTSTTISRSVNAEPNVDLTIPTGTNKLPYSLSFDPTKCTDLFLTCDKSVSIDVNGNNDVQTWTHPGSGSPTLTFGAQVTTGLPVTSTAAQVQTAFQLLSTVGANNASVAGPTGGPYVITFTGSLGLAPQSAITPSAGSVAHTTTGVVPTKTITYIAGEPGKWVSNDCFFPTCPLPATTLLSFTNNSGGDASLQLYIGLTVP